MSKSIDRYISVSSSKQIRVFCNPLYLHGIIGFNHDISFPNGELSMLTTEEGIFRLWFNKRIPAVCTDVNGRNLKSGVYLDNYLKSKYTGLEASLNRFHSGFKANRSIHILEEDNGCQHLYSFVFYQVQANEFLHWVTNNLYFLQNFLQQYKLQSSELINEAKKPFNRIVLPIEASTSATEDQLSQMNTDGIAQAVMHKETKIPVYLSKQQSICLALLMQGKTAKEIAGQMKLSHRTVQHYFERIKKILGCNSIKELIIAYGDQVVSEKWKILRELFE